MKEGAFNIYSYRSLIIFIVLILSSAYRLEAQSTPFEVKSTGYTILVNSKPVDFNLYNIHNSQYCLIEDLARAMPGIFEVEEKSARNRDETQYPQFWITSGKRQGGTTHVSRGKSYPAQSVYAHLYYNGQRAPSTPYKINNGYYFKLADILRLLDIELVVNNAKRTIEINTEKPYVLPEPKIPQPGPAPKKWTRIPANVGVAISQLNGYFDINSSTLLFNHTVEDHLSANALVLVNIPTGRRIELPFDE
ncbi:MAG: hypothetical protein EOM61_11190 [Bacteroidia bacterium]|nr:hypothetical protein [Bacteroidia bacterium]